MCKCSEVGRPRNQRVAYPNAPQSGTEETALEIAPFRLALGCSLEVGDQAEGVIELPIWIGIDISFELRVSCICVAERVSRNKIVG
jgi:hypothetical protein